MPNMDNKLRQSLKMQTISIPRLQQTFLHRVSNLSRIFIGYTLLPFAAATVKLSPKNQQAEAVLKLISMTLIVCLRNFKRELIIHQWV